MNTYLLENLGDFLAVESQVEPLHSLVGIGSTAPGAGVCENRLRSKCSSASCLQLTWKQEEADGVSGALHGIALAVQIKLKRGYSVCHSRALRRGGAEPRNL